MTATGAGAVSSCGGDNTVVMKQTPLKVLYVERFRLTLDYWLNGWYDMQAGRIVG